MDIGAGVVGTIQGGTARGEALVMKPWTGQERRNQFAEGPARQERRDHFPEGVAPFRLDFVLEQPAVELRPRSGKTRFWRF
jgi:hypothetical protein